MMFVAVTNPTLARLAADTAKLRDEGLFKQERVLTTPQDAVVRVDDGPEVINLCANNYLGLANHPEIRAAVLACGPMSRNAIPEQYPLLRTLQLSHVGYHRIR